MKTPTLILWSKFFANMRTVSTSSGSIGSPLLEKSMVLTSVQPKESL